MMGSKEIAAWKSFKGKFEQKRRNMQGRAKEFRDQATAKISDPNRQKDAIEIADLLLSSSWIRVFAAGVDDPVLPPPLRRPDSICFERSHWPELPKLHEAIDHCHEAYRRYSKAYDMLTDAEKTGGLPQP
jgi:hypothetical protein